MDFSALVHRVRSEFLEMPGLRLTLAQACRLWGLDHDRCREVVNTLVGVRFLKFAADGTILRAE
jgi:hypothetical protein